jgi:hypothetical protein
MMRLKSAGFATLAAVAVMLVGSAVAPSCVQAQGSGCVDNCRASFGACYKATSNRAACEGQLQRCMQGCIASKRG